MKNQSSNELRVFQKFASIAPIGIDLGSIQKREPPEPDIFCYSKDYGSLRFELTEAIDESIAQSIYSSTQLDKLIRSKFDLLPGDVKKKFINAGIRIDFDHNTTINKKKHLVGAVLSSLKDFPENVVGEIDLEIDGIKGVEISRADFGGPIFSFNTTTSFFDVPIIQRLEEKFAKIYSFEEEVHLLVYLDLQPELPANTWLTEAMEYVKANIAKSSIKKVWFYSMTKDKILGVYP